MPTAEVPGILSTTLRLGTDIVLAKSLDKFIIWLTLIPLAGVTSNNVTTGPGLTEVTSVSIPKSLRLLSSSLAISCNESLSRDAASLG